MSRTGTYDRDRILEQASRARSKRQQRRAVALYRWVLAVERNSIDIHTRLAPLLAELGQDFDAWNSYRTIAQAALREGREDRAIAIYREATRALPSEIGTWQNLARLLVRQGELEEAVEILREGSRQFRAHWNRSQAIHLLRRARAIDPWHFQSVIELSRLLGRSDQEAEAYMLLEGLAERCEGRHLRIVRGALLRVAPGAGTLWGWLTSWLRRSSDDFEDLEDEDAPAADVVKLRAVSPAEASPAQGVAASSASGVPVSGGASLGAAGAADSDAELSLPATR